MQNFFAQKKIGKVSVALEPCPPWENVSSNRSKRKKFEQTKPPKCCEWNNTHAWFVIINTQFLLKHSFAQDLESVIDTHV
jgi:hypothetical protein